MYAAILRALALALMMVEAMPTKADLVAVFGRGAKPLWVEACIEGWNNIVQTADLSTPLRQAHFLAQLAHESQGCRVFEENLNYTTAARLRAVWPRRFPTIARAKPYVRNPSALANRVYANRLGNGSEGSGDGWRYRGRGPIQLTGRINYRHVGRLIGMDLEEDPDLVLKPEVGWLVAAAFWNDRGCNVQADQDDIEGVTRIINGGTHGLPDRRAYLAKAKKALN